MTDQRPSCVARYCRSVGRSDVCPSYGPPLLSENLRTCIGRTCIYVLLWGGVFVGTQKGWRLVARPVFAVETQVESSVGMLGRNEKKLGSRTSLGTENIARDSFFLVGEFGEMC